MPDLVLCAVTYGSGTAILVQQIHARDREDAKRIADQKLPLLVLIPGDWAWTSTRGPGLPKLSSFQQVQETRTSEEPKDE